MNLLRSSMVLASLLMALAPVGAVAASNCGADGQPICVTFPPTFPPCNADLTVNLQNGKCYRPKCGKHNKTACAPAVRLQPCDYGLVPDPAQGMKCVKPRETAAAKAITLEAAQQICKAAVSGILSGRLPPELQHYVNTLLDRSVVGEMQRTIDSRPVQKATGEFIARNIPLINELGKVAVVVRKKSREFRDLFAPDEVCGQRTAAQWIAKLKAHGFYPNLEAIKLAATTSEGSLIPVASKEPESWWLGFEYGIEATAGWARTVHVVTLLIGLNYPGGKVMLLYKPYIGASTPNLFGGNVGAVKLYWPSTRDEHSWLGGVATGALAPGAIIHLIQLAGYMAGVPTPPEPFGIDIALDVVWGDVLHRLFKGNGWPGGIGGAVAVGVETPLPIPVQLGAGIDGGIRIFEIPFDWTDYCKTQKEHLACKLGS